MIGASKRLSIGLSLVVFLSLVFGVSPVGGAAKLAYPDMDFSAEPTSGYAPLEVEFTDETTFDSSSTESVGLSRGFVNRLFGFECVHVVTWDFGDGAVAETGPQEGTTHTYTSPGEYTVTMTYTEVCDGSPLSFVPLLPCLGTDVSFDTTGFSKTLEKRLYIEVLTRPVKEKERDKPPEPANLAATNLYVNPTEVIPGQEVLIYADVCNSGGEVGVKSATLFINGYAEQSQSAGAGPGQCATVVFRVYKGPPGTYLVNVEGMQGQFTVVAPRIVMQDVPSQQDTGIGTVGIIAIVVVGIVLIIALVLIFKKE